MPRLSTSTVVPSVALLAVLTTGADRAPPAPVASLPDDEPQPDTAATVATANAAKPHRVRVMLFIASSFRSRRSSLWTTAIGVAGLCGGSQTASVRRP